MSRFRAVRDCIGLAFARDAWDVPEAGLDRSIMETGYVDGSWFCMCEEDSCMRCRSQRIVSSLNERYKKAKVEFIRARFQAKVITRVKR